MEQIFIAILLGIVEGVTEFLPVSSTGHLILLIDILGFESPKGKVFEIVVQLGAILAICFLFRQKITKIMLGFFKEQSARALCYKIITACLPAAILGVLFHSFIKQVLFNPTIVCLSLIIGGFVMLLIERIKPPAEITDVEQVNYLQALTIGFCQAIAMIPGVSRSGATMMGSMMLGINRKTAAEFTFLLAIPTMFAASLYDIYKNIHHLQIDEAKIIAIGFISAFISALLAVSFLLKYLTSHDFKIFAYYRIVLGLLMLMLL
jgi:undecaprenyl-diphosphatase